MMKKACKTMNTLRDDGLIAIDIAAPGRNYIVITIEGSSIRICASRYQAMLFCLIFNRSRFDRNTTKYLLDVINEKNDNAMNAIIDAMKKHEKSLPSSTPQTPVKEENVEATCPPPHLPERESRTKRLRSDDKVHDEFLETLALGKRTQIVKKRSVPLLGGVKSENKR